MKNIMTNTQKLALFASALAIAAFATAASAQTPDTRIEVIGAINTPAHVQSVTDGRDNSVPEMPVVYENQAQSTPASAQSAPAPANDASHAQAQTASTSGANINQTVKSQ